MLTRRVSLKRGKLRKRSKRASRQQSARQACLRIVRARAQGRCEAMVGGVCNGIGCDGHEIVKRSRGGSIVDPNNVLWVCRFCHEWIETHETKAHALGLSRKSWEKE